MMQILPGTITDVLVYGQYTGSITACTVTGSTGPFTYAWDDGSQEADRYGLREGLYGLTVTDMVTLEEAEHTYNVTQNDPISVETPGTVTDAAFRIASGSIGPPVVIGGDGAYTYKWRDWLAHYEPTRADLRPGEYVLIINDTVGSATVLHTYAVGEYEPLAISIAGAISHVSVKGDATGKIGPSVFSGGSSDYSAAWGDDSSAVTSECDALVAGDYTLTVTDGCGSTPQNHVFHVGENARVTIKRGGVVSPSLGEAKGSIGVAMIEGGNGFFTYAWDDNVAITSASRTALDEGVYTVFISDTDGAEPCEHEYTVSKHYPIVVTPGEVQPSIGLGADNGIIFPSTVSGDSGAFQFLWDDRSDPSPTTFRSELPYGHYTLTVSDVEDIDNYAEVQYTVKQYKKPPPKRPAHRLRLPGF
ncbi:hypothetical protein JKP88DRAFT_285313 [Tribonema minus]|uniref:Uncharacterized protein n=1 Tax=Tribonema minus TaxID=303371 RepID=A0A835ZFH1_9STRA|nr:hypothetical protein JKP88DRAFT_285313 [Tribonema minus]